MGLSNLINNLDVQKAKEWANQQSEAKWAAEQEEKRRQERAEDRKKLSGAASKVAGAVTGGSAAPKTTGLTQVSGASSGTTYSAAREKAAEQAQQAAEPPKPKTYGNTELSYSGAGASDRTKELEAQWFAPKQPEAQQPAVTVSETGTEAQPESSGAGSKPRRSGEERAEAQAPIVYTPQGSTTYSTAEARNTAANTKAELTGEESGMSEEQMAWLQTPEGQAALANQQARQANDATLRNSKLNSGITFQGQPITQDKRLTGQPMSTEEAARLAAVNSSIAAAEASRNYRDGTPGGQRYVPAATNTGAGLVYGGAAQPAAGSGAVRETGLPNPQVIDRNAAAAATPQTSGVTAPSFGEALKGTVQGALNDFLASRMGNGTPAGITAEQAAYINNPNTGPQLQGSQVPSFGDVLQGIVSTEQPNVIKRPASVAQAERQQAFEDALANGQITETIPEGGYRIPGTNTYAYEPGGQTSANNGRPGVDAALQEIMDKANAAGLTYGGANQPAATGNTPAVNTKVTGAASKVSGATTGSEATGTGTSGKKGTYFTPSYGQAMDKGVKLPYKAGGYTAAEIEAAGNKARSDEKYYTGDKAYEGYYLAPNGKYYPIDQEKAAYYIKNGGSYKGWEEPMREYYNTFGTFYGYRPDWKTAGGKNVWKQNNSSGNGGRYYSNRSNNLSYSGASSGRSYGRGSTANNGMYWNGNTSWSI